MFSKEQTSQSNVVEHDCPATHALPALQSVTGGGLPSGAGASASQAPNAAASAMDTVTYRRMKAEVRTFIGHGFRRDVSSKVDRLCDATLHVEGHRCEGRKTASVGPTLKKHLPLALLGNENDRTEYLEEWRKWAIKGTINALPGALKELPKLLDPQQFLHDKMLAIKAFGFAIPDRDADTFMKKFNVFKECAAGGFIVSKILEDGSTVLEAFKTAWQRYGLAVDVMAANTENSGFLADVLNQERMMVDRAAGFLKTRQSRGQTTLYEGPGSPGHKPVTYSKHLSVFESLVAANTGGTVSKEFAFSEVAKFLASSPKGLDDMLPNDWPPSSKEAESAKSRAAKLAEDIKKAVQLAAQAKTNTHTAR